MRPAPGSQNAVINHFASEAALEIEEYRDVQQLARRECQERSLMEIGVDQVRTQEERLLQSQRA